MMEREAAMQVDARTMKSVVFLGEPAGDGFRADGTAFFLSVTEEDAEDFVYLVACRHVVRPFKDREQTEPDDSSIWIRVNRSGSRPLHQQRTTHWDCEYGSTLSCERKVPGPDATGNRHAAPVHAHEAKPDPEGTALPIEDHV